MKNLFFVSVALGIFSGTSTVKAQTSINIMKVNDGTVTSAKAPHFIEGIEIKRDNNVPAQTIAVTATQNTVTIPAMVTAKPVAKPATSSVDFSASIEKCSSLQFKYAQLMDLEVEAITNFTLYNFVEDWWGTRYRYGGSTKAGVDCSAFTGALSREVFGTNLPRTARDQYAASEKIDKEDLKEGDLVFFNTRGGISHVGVYLGNSYFVHSSVHSGVTISSLEENYYNKKYIGGGRVAAAETAAQ